MGWTTRILAWTVLLSVAASGAAAPPRFFVYRDADSRDNHGDWTNFMPRGASARNLWLGFAEPERDRAGDDETCIRLEMKRWPREGWVGVAVACKANYWGERPFSGAYDLRGSGRLAFRARGELGGETIRVRALFTGDKPHGDSAKQSASSPWITLTATWQRYEIDLLVSDLERVVIPFAVFADVAHNRRPALTFYLDDIAFEPAHDPPSLPRAAEQ